MQFFLFSLIWGSSKSGREIEFLYDFYEKMIKNERKQLTIPGVLVFRNTKANNDEKIKRLAVREGSPNRVTFQKTHRIVINGRNTNMYAGRCEKSDVSTMIRTQVIQIGNWIFVLGKNTDTDCWHISGIYADRLYTFKVWHTTDAYYDFMLWLTYCCIPVLEPRALVHVDSSNTNIHYDFVQF